MSVSVGLSPSDDDSNGDNEDNEDIESSSDSIGDSGDEEDGERGILTLLLDDVETRATDEEHVDMATVAARRVGRNDFILYRLVRVSVEYE